MAKAYKCAICGVSSEKKIVKSVHGVLMCSKHKAQFYRHGKIVDTTSRTTNDRNQIIMHDNYAELIVCDKRNKKELCVLIDKDDVVKVLQYKWRCEHKNKNKIGYIVTGDSRKGRIYLHRFVINYWGELQVDHINRNILDNRKNNLRAVPQIINTHNVTSRNNNIEKRPGNKYRVKITRYKRVFIFGLFDTIKEAESVRDEFLEFIKLHEKEMTENYYKENNKGNRNTTFIENGKPVHTKMYKTVEETVKNRTDLIALLNAKQKAS